MRQLHELSLSCQDKLLLKKLSTAFPHIGQYMQFYELKILHFFPCGKSFYLHIGTDFIRFLKQTRKH